MNRETDTAEREHTRPVLIGEEKAKLVFSDPKATGHLLLAAIGGIAVMGGVIKLLLLWFPLGLGVAAWQFGTLHETIDSLPSTALGAALLAYGIVRNPATGVTVVKGLSIAFAVLAFALLVGALIFVQAVPSVLAEAPDVALSALRRSIVETLFELIVYLAGCVTVSVVLWRSLRKP